MTDMMSELMAALGIQAESVQHHSDTPDLERVQTALDLFKDQERRLEESENAEIGMLTPRITLREHTDMHLLSDAMDEYMTKMSDDWAHAVALYAVGNEHNSLEDLNTVARAIGEAAVLRRAIGRIHTAWGAENTLEEEHSETFNPFDDEPGGDEI